MKQIYRNLKKYAKESIPGIYNVIDKNKVIAKYLISGGTATITNLGTFYILITWVDLWYLIATNIAFLISFFVSFYLQKFWTFRDTRREGIQKQMALYLIVAILNLIINTGGMYVLVDKFNTYPLFSQIIMGALLAIGSFLIYKFLIFKKGMKNKNIDNKNILIATGIFPPDIGGPATMLEAMASSLVGRGFEVKVITYSEQNLEFRIKNSEVLVTRILKNKLFSRLKYFLQMKKLAKWADVIYVTDTYSVGYFAYLIKKLTNKKYVVRFAGDSAWETAVANGWTDDYIVDFQKNKYNSKIKKLKAKRKKILVNADKVIAVSNFMKEIAQAIGVVENKIQTIYNSVDFIKNDSFDINAIENIKKQYGKNPPSLRYGETSNKIIVTACRLTPWKGVAGIIKIMPKLDNVNFLVLGDGQELDNLKKLATELGINDKVYFLGKIKQTEMINYFKAANLFILNTNYEGLSHTVLEAMSAGTPVLTTNVGGNPEVIDNSKDGMLVSFNDKQELLKAATKILNDKEFANSLVANAEIKLRKFNWSNTVESTAKLLKKM